MMSKLPGGAILPLRDIDANEIREAWRKAERQISAGLKQHGLELHVDPDGNYSVVDPNKPTTRALDPQDWLCD